MLRVIKHFYKPGKKVILINILLLFKNTGFKKIIIQESNDKNLLPVLMLTIKHFPAIVNFTFSSTAIDF